jgi:hypothetical protein
VLTVRAGGFEWDLRREDGSEQGPHDATDSVSDHGLWGLLDPASLFESAQVDVVDESRSEFRLRPLVTPRHQLPDGTPTTTNIPKPSWVSIAPDLYVAEAAYYRARLEEPHAVVQTLAAVQADTTERVLRSWTLIDIEFDVPLDIAVRPRQREGS